MAFTAFSSRRPGTRTVVVASLAVVVALLVLVGGLTTMAWGGSLRDEQRLLPGTTVAGVDVGDATVTDALEAVQHAVADDLDRTVTITFGDRQWTTTPGALAATADVEAVVADAFQRTTRANLLDLARRRFGVGGGASLDVGLDPADDAVAAFVADLAAEVDRSPVDATLTWVDGGVHLEESVTGRRVAQQDAVAAVEAAVAEGRSTVELPVEQDLPDVETAEAAGVAEQVQAAVDAAMDHVVTITLEDSTIAVSPRTLGAGHNAAELLAAGGGDRGDVEVQLPEGRLAEVIDELADQHEVASQDAQLTWSPGGGFASTPGATGLAVDEEAAVADVRAAVLGGGDHVDLQLHPTQPDITTDDFDEVLLVRQGARRVDLYRGGQVVRSWPVAVGTSGHPTPTGLFTIGAKRFEPTWHNSSPDGWGSDMPASIGPGPDNPLGLRALNWMQNGYDTLIRFHGTANEASIGNAASHGCVRMTNPDVIELFELVDTGTVIVSTTAA